MGSEIAAVVFGLLSALSWGAGDFSGGMATKRSSVQSVVVVSQLVGITLLFLLALFTREPFPPAGALLWGALAGIFGSLGIVALYQGLALGRMGVVAPLSAVVTAGVPIIVGVFLEGLPTNTQMAGFALALLAVWLISRSGGGQRAERRDIGLAFLAGVGFAGFLVFIAQASNDGIYWPLVSARFASIVALSLGAVLTGRSLRPAAGQLPLIFLAGVMEVGGNVFFAMAARAGRLDIAAILGALYPASTVLLARLILKEEISRQQWLGIAFALLAVVLIAI